MFYSFITSGLILKTKVEFKTGVFWTLSPIKSLRFDGLAYSDLKNTSSETTVGQWATAVGIWWQWSILNKYVSVVGQMKNTTAGTHWLSQQRHHLIGTEDYFLLMRHGFLSPSWGPYDRTCSISVWIMVTEKVWNWDLSPLQTIWAVDLYSIF